MPGLLSIQNGDILSKRIKLSHGGGGSLSAELIRDHFLPHFDNPLLQPLEDSAIFTTESGRLAMTTDSYVVDPLFFPGGDIGVLAVCGTVNDLAVRGARPLHLSAGFIIEEGFELELLDRVVRSMAETARAAGVQVIAGDTKVVPRGAADKLFINTAGVGRVPAGIELGANRVEPGDAVIVTGGLGEHGLTILLAREDLGVRAEVVSDVAALHDTLHAPLKAGLCVHAMRDLTRGGLAAITNEIALSASVEIVLQEERLPIKASVRAACELLGLDPLILASEGLAVVFVPEGQCSAVLEILRKDAHAREATVIVHVVKGPGRVILKTAVGGSRRLAMPVGESLPRIC